MCVWWWGRDTDREGGEEREGEGERERQRERERMNTRIFTGRQIYLILRGKS